jgi:EAL domain-containing protein (putative c-di-GMP-specific phosphodiesterase class I)
LVVTLNLDARQFHEPGLHLSMARWLQQMGLHAENLGLEIDESIIRARPIESAEIIHNLRGMGLRVYIEGAQGGPGTLEIVHTLRPEGIKLNRLLVAALDERWAIQVVESITRTLFAMEVEVTAVGVSTASQYERLCALEVPRVQGYLFAPPLPEKLADSMLIENARARIQMA